MKTPPVIPPPTGQPVQYVIVQQPPRRSFLGTLFTVVILAFLFLLALPLGIGIVVSQSKKPPTPPREIPDSELARIPAETVFAAYTANEVAADRDYKDKLGIVVGSIDSIGKDILDHPYVTIEARGHLFKVQCVFDRSAEPTLARLNKGEMVAIRGVFKGKMGNVLVEKCRLVQ